MDGLVKVNLGSALAVKSGWINIDASLNARIASWPRLTRRLFFRLSDSRNHMSEEKYLETASDVVLVQHDVRYSLPFADATVDCVYSSHLFEYLSYDEARALLVEVRRVLRPRGILRLCVLDFGRVFSEFASAEKLTALRKVLFDPAAPALAQPRAMYDFPLLKFILEGSGFGDVTACTYGTGSMPDVQQLDNRPHETLYVEARVTSHDESASRQ